MECRFFLRRNADAQATGKPVATVRLGHGLRSWSRRGDRRGRRGGRSRHSGQGLGHAGARGGVGQGGRSHPEAGARHRVHREHGVLGFDGRELFLIPLEQGLDILWFPPGDDGGLRLRFPPAIPGGRRFDAHRVTGNVPSFIRTGPHEECRGSADRKKCNQGTPTGVLWGGCRGAHGRGIRMRMPGRRSSGATALRSSRWARSTPGWSRAMDQ